MLPLDDDGELPPPPPPPPAPPPPPPPPPSIEVPLEWLMGNGAQPIQYRSLTSFVDADLIPAHWDRLAFSAASGQLAVAQAADGVWNHAMLEVPAEGARQPWLHTGTFPAVVRLVELGWDANGPTLHNARRPLFRLLAEDSDPAFLYEMASHGKDVDTAAWSRTVLRSAAAAALARAGYERDPRLRGVATRLVERVDEFIGSDLAEDPWVKVGGTHAISPDAFPPTIHFVMMMAFMPEFRNERDDFIDRLATYLSQPWPKHPLVQSVSGKALAHPGLLLGDPFSTKAGVDGDIPFALTWLEFAARLSMLGRHESAQKTYERFLDGRDRDLVWQPSKGQVVTTSHAATWAFADLQGQGPAGIAAEATYRLSLIGKLSGRTVEFV